MARNGEDMTVTNDLFNLIDKQPDIMSISEVAQFLGVKRNTVYEWINEGKLDAIKVIGTYRVTKNSLREMVEKYSK